MGREEFYEVLRERAGVRRSRPHAEPPLARGDRELPAALRIPATGQVTYQPCTVSADTLKRHIDGSYVDEASFADKNAGTDTPAGTEPGTSGQGPSEKKA